MRLSSSVRYVTNVFENTVTPIDGKYRIMDKKNKHMQYSGLQHYYRIPIKLHSKGLSSSSSSIEFRNCGLKGPVRVSKKKIFLTNLLYLIYVQATLNIINAHLPLDLPLALAP